MKKLFIALALLLVGLTLEGVAAVAPAGADSTCHVASPDLNNSYFCVKGTLSYDIGGYPYYISVPTQVKAVGYVTQVQVRRGSDGAWFGCGPQVGYSPSSWGVATSWCGSTWRPTRARVVLTNIYTGAVSTYGWNPFPLV